MTFFASHVECDIRNSDFIAFFDGSYCGENKGEAFEIPVPFGIRFAAYIKRCYSVNDEKKKKKREKGLKLTYGYTYWFGER